MTPITWLLTALMAVLAAQTAAQNPNCGTPSDVLFILDKSASIKNWQFDIMRNIIAKIIGAMDVSEDMMHVGMVLYANGVHKKWCFDRYFDQDELIQAVHDMECPECEKGQTSTGLAMEYSRNNMFTEECGIREQGVVPRKIVLLTDGKSTEVVKLGKPKTWIKDQGTLLRDATGAHVTAVGVGNYDLKELMAIASDEASAVTADDFNQINKIVDDLIAGAGACPLPTTLAQPTTEADIPTTVGPLPTTEAAIPSTLGPLPTTEKTPAPTTKTTTTTTTTTTTPEPTVKTPVPTVKTTTTTTPEPTVKTPVPTVKTTTTTTTTPEPTVKTPVPTVKTTTTTTTTPAPTPPPTTTRTTTTTTTKAPSCEKPGPDLVYVVDESGSMTETDWLVVKEYVENKIRNYGEGDDEEGHEVYPIHLNPEANPDEYSKPTLVDSAHRTTCGICDKGITGVNEILNYVEEPCERSWIFHKETGQCYKFFDEQVNQELAMDNCEKKHNGELPEVESRDMQDFLREISTGQTWLGLHGDTGKWKWAASGDDLKYSASWDRGQPGGSKKGKKGKNSGSCAVMSPSLFRKWQTFNCKSKANYVCTKAKK